MPRTRRISPPVDVDTSGSATEQSSNSFVILPSGQVLPVMHGATSSPARSQMLKSLGIESNFGRKSSNAFSKQKDTSTNGEQNVDFRRSFEEETEYVSEAEDQSEEVDDEDEEEEDENVADDEPSTSTGRRLGRNNETVSIGDVPLESLMSTETEDLLKEMRSAYEKQTRGRRIPKPRRYEEDAEESDECEDQDDDDQDDVDDAGAYDDDPTDADYRPKGARLKNQKKRPSPIKVAKFAGATKRQASFSPAMRRGSANVGQQAKRWPADIDMEESYRNVRSKQQALSWDESIWSDDDLIGEGEKRRKSKKMPPEVESLMGQANVSFAQGRREEALKMMEEVVRLHPSYYEPYDVLSVFYGMMGKKEKQLHFGLLSAHLDSGYSGEKWAELAELCVEFGDIDRAIRCYTKAHRAKPTKWEFYESKIILLEKKLESADENNRGVRDTILRQVSDTKLAAVKGLFQNTDTLSTEEYTSFCRKIFEQFYDNNDVRRAISCLKCVLERGQLAGSSVAYDDLNHLMNMAMHAKDYEDALLAVVRYSNLQAFNNTGLVQLREDQFSERTEPHRRFRPLTREGGENIIITHYTVPEGFPVDLMSKTIVCWIRLKRYDCAQPLLSMLQSEVAIASAPDAYWEIAESLADGSWCAEAEILLEQLVQTEEYENSSTLWLCYAEVLSSQGKLESASAAFAHVVRLSPYHVSARLSLSALQQQLGQMEEALQTLDIGEGRMVALDRLDERLLYQSCVLLMRQKSWNQFLTTARYLMAMYFKESYSTAAGSVVSNLRWGKWKLTSACRAVIMDTVRQSNWERLIQRMPRVETVTVSPEEIWDIFLKMCELIYERRMITDLFYACCFATQCPNFLLGSNLRTVITLLLFTSLLKRNSKITWTLFRNCLPEDDTTLLWNIYGFLFSFCQEIRYHKFTLRAMLRMPDSIPLAWLSANNSLITGTYQHALAEYFYILQHRPDDPLLNLLIGLCFVHLAARKFTARRHDLFIQGMAFISKYEELRGPCQEVYYNIGRAMHQTGVLYAAVHYYKKALDMDVASTTTSQTHRGVGQSIYDLRPIIAHNLALIYQHSGNTLMARDLLQEYCTVE